MESYIGYYLTGKKRKKPSINHVDECERDPSHEITFGAYCPVCGGMIVPVEKTTFQTLDIYDVPEEEGFLEDQFIFPEYISPEGKFVAISNFNAQNSAKEGGDGGVVCLDDIGKEELYKKFMKQHEEDIRLLKEYVYDDVEINFGIVTYYM